jgi:hypothetical protein
LISPSKTPLLFTQSTLKLFLGYLLVLDFSIFEFRYRADSVLVLDRGKSQEDGEIRRSTGKYGERRRDTGKYEKIRNLQTQQTLNQKSNPKHKEQNLQ